MMFSSNTLVSRIWNRFSRAQRKLQALLVKKADELRVCLLTIDMLFVIKEQEKLAIANVIPDIRPMPGQLHDFALLYLELPYLPIPNGFYRLQLAFDATGGLLPAGILTNAQGQPVGTVRLIAVDLFAAINGPRGTNEKRTAFFDVANFHQTGIVLSGIQANGQAFVVAIDF